MPRMADNLRWILLVVAALTGCSQNPYTQPSGAGMQPMSPQQAQLYDLNRRAVALDQNNQDLHAQLAQSRQQVQVLRDQASLLQTQLAETARQLQATQIAKADVEQKYSALQTSTAQRGGAIITANNKASSRGEG
jgi:chromosome segregation ATPase